MREWIVRQLLKAIKMLGYEYYVVPKNLTDKSKEVLRLCSRLDKTNYSGKMKNCLAIAELQNLHGLSEKDSRFAVELEMRHR